MIFVLLFCAFKSMRKALLVILMVPFTLIGGLAGLGLAGLHMSVSAAVGFIAVGRYLGAERGDHGRTVHRGNA